MGTLYVARSASVSEWASDVGLSKNVFKIGYTDEPIDEVVQTGWAGAEDWTLVRKREIDGLDEAAMLARLQRKEKMIDPAYYPKIKGATGIFKVPPEHVQNHILVAKTLANEELSPKSLRVKPTDFADYLIHNATR